MKTFVFAVVLSLAIANQASAGPLCSLGKLVGKGAVAVAKGSAYVAKDAAKVAQKASAYTGVTAAAKAIEKALCAI